MIREKRHRLAYEVYRGSRAVSITACVKKRVSFFTTEARFAIFEGMLLDALKKFQCEAEVYLFMPDHAHLLLRGKCETSDILGAMRAFKQKSGFWLSCHHSSVRWQKDYYDHILRSDEALEKHVFYILNNPVRKGIVENWKKYPFKGSTVYNLDDWD